MSSGLTFNPSSLKVTIGTAVFTATDASAGVTITAGSPSNGFTVDIDMTKYQTTPGINGEVKIEYNGTVNTNAVTKIDENHAVLKYSNDPTDSTTKTENPPVIVKTFSAKIVIDKIKEGEEATKLGEAVFVLKNTHGDNSGKFYKRDGDVVSWVASQDDATPVTTDENGAAEFEGLENGTYDLIETKAPTGYNLRKDPVPVTINGTNVDAGTLTVTSQVGNSAGAILPTTGGVGTTLFYMVGGIMVAVAGVLLITRKRMKAE